MSLEPPSSALRLPRVAVAILVQAVAAITVVALARLAGLSPPLWAVAIAIGAAAAAGTWLVRLETWWIIIALLFAPLLLAMLALDWPAWVYLALFGALALIYGSTFRTRVPLYLSNAETWQAVESLLPAPQPGKTLQFIDLGCGLGGLLCHLGAQRPDILFTGIEVAPVPALICRLRAGLTGERNLRVHWGSFWNHDLAAYDVVFAFLSPVPMPELWRKAQREMRRGSLFVSCAFEVPGSSPDQVIELSSPRQPRLLAWRIGEAPHSAAVC